MSWDCPKCKEPHRDLLPYCINCGEPLDKSFFEMIESNVLHPTISIPEYLYKAATGEQIYEKEEKPEPPIEPNARLDLWAKRLWAKLGTTREHQNYGRFIQILHNRSLNDWHTVIPVSGQAGSGKSNFTIVSGILLRLFNFKFDFSHISYGNENLDSVVEKMTSTDKGVFVFDEGIEAGDSRRFMSKVNSVITTNLTKVRKKNHVFFWNIPDMSDLDTRIKNKNAVFWIHVMYRRKHVDRTADYSVASLQRKNLVPGVSDKWGLTLLERKYRNAPVFTQEKLRKVFRSLKGNHMAFLRTPRLPKILEDEYQAESEKALASQGREGAAELTKKPKKGKKSEEEE